MDSRNYWDERWSVSDVKPIERYVADAVRRVVAKTCDETGTDYDPEMIAREVLPEDRRRRLR